jgi:hypothetical protein
MGRALLTTSSMKYWTLHGSRSWVPSRPFIPGRLRWPLAATLFAHVLAAFGVHGPAGLGGGTCSGWLSSAEEASERVDDSNFEEERVDALLLVGGVAGAELGDGGVVLSLRGELTYPGGDGRADGVARVARVWLVAGELSRVRPVANADLPILSTLDVRVFGADHWPLLMLLLGVAERALVAENRRRLARPVGEAGVGGQGLRVVGAEDLLADGQQVGVLVAGQRRVARLAGPVGEATASGKGLRVVGAEDPLADGQQVGKLVAG